MTRRFCFLGDSHLGALKQGWAQGAASDFPDLDITFFAGANPEWVSLERSGENLLPRSDWLRHGFKNSAGTEIIECNYDCYAVCGISFGPVFTIREAVEAKDAGMDILADSFLISLQNRSRAELHVAPALSVVKNIRSIVNAPILLSPAPFPPRQKTLPAAKLTALEMGVLADLIAEIFRDVAMEVGAILVPQPVSTLARNGVMSKGEFANLDSRDRFHLNAAYGAVAVESLVRTALQQSS